MISDEQFKLNRLANAAIDIYCMVSVLSRASRSMKRGQPSAEYEATVASVFCDEVSISQWELLRNMFLLSFNCIPTRGSTLIVTGIVVQRPLKCGNFNVWVILYVTVIYQYLILPLLCVEKLSSVWKRKCFLKQTSKNFI